MKRMNLFNYIVLYIEDKKYNYVKKYIYHYNYEVCYSSPDLVFKLDKDTKKLTLNNNSIDIALENTYINVSNNFDLSYIPPDTIKFKKDIYKYQCKIIVSYFNEVYYILYCHNNDTYSILLMNKDYSTVYQYINCYTNHYLIDICDKIDIKTVKNGNHYIIAK